MSARRRAQPPPPNGHVGAQGRRRLFFLILRTGLRGGPPPRRLCLGRPPRRLGRSLFLPGLQLRSSSPPPAPQARPVPRPRSAAARGLCDRRARSSRRRSANMDAVNAFNQEVRGAWNRRVPGLPWSRGVVSPAAGGLKLRSGWGLFLPRFRGGGACAERPVAGEVAAAAGADPTPLPHLPLPGGDLGLPLSPPSGLLQPASAPVPLTSPPFRSGCSRSLLPAPYWLRGTGSPQGAKKEARAGVGGGGSRSICWSQGWRSGGLGSPVARAAARQRLDSDPGSGRSWRGCSSLSPGIPTLGKWA